MTKKLHTILLFIAILFSLCIQAQSKHLEEVGNLFHQKEIGYDLTEHTHDKDFQKEEVFSYMLVLDGKMHFHSEHSDSPNLSPRDISLIDIISSDEGADFNCSGGFCMDRSHFHKRGLTLKKQLFDYFMKISC